MMCPKTVCRATATMITKRTHWLNLERLFPAPLHNKACIGKRRMRRGEEPGRRGYTLIEMMIAAVLVTVVLAATWNLLGSFSGLFEKGQARTQRAQLVRSLVRQFNDDLLAVVRPESADAVSAPRQSSPEHSDSDASSFAPQFVGLVGSAESLTLDVTCAVTPHDLVSSGDAGSTDATHLEGIPTVSQTPDVERVVYRFSSPEALDFVVQPAGLMLRRSNWDRVHVSGLAGADDLRPDALRSYLDPAAEAAFAAGRTPENNSDVLESDAAAVVAAGVDHLPEIAHGRFRYFDGSRWRNHWDARTQRALPVAVEILFDLVDANVSARADRSSGAVHGNAGGDVDVDEVRDAAEQQRRWDETNVADQEIVDDAQEGGGGWRPQYRWMVYLRPSASPAPENSRPVDQLAGAYHE